MKPSEILKKIKLNPDKECGICNNYYQLAPCNQTQELETVMSKNGISFYNWKYFSGCSRYPVPAHIDLEKAYDKLNKWSKKSNYGRLRWQLLDWLIEQFESKGA